MDLQYDAWLRERSFHHSRFPAERLAAERTATVSVCVPAREEARTIGPIVRDLVGLREAGVIDQVVVADAESADGTGRIAAEEGAEVHVQSELLSGYGPCAGKGDAMWRALSVLHGEVVLFVDADSEDFGPHFACGLLGPLLLDETIHYVKAFYRRPFKLDSACAPEGGGRVTELTARPLLNLFYPQLALFAQPLAGEIAARRSLFERLPWSSGYAIEITQLIDAWAEVGLWGMAQVDLDVRQNRHQSLHDLGPMAYAVLRGVTERLVREGRLTAEQRDAFVTPGPHGLEEHRVELVERPPMATLAAGASA
ncbi:MAG TPA: glucosyl-3-phosphoglycerate synthase [Thermoleophilaceae bacterium]